MSKFIETSRNVLNQILNQYRDKKEVEYFLEKTKKKYGVASLIECYEIIHSIGIEVSYIRFLEVNCQLFGQDNKIIDKNNFNELIQSGLLINENEDILNLIWKSLVNPLTNKLDRNSLINLIRHFSENSDEVIKDNFIEEIELNMKGMITEKDFIILWNKLSDKEYANSNYKREEPISPIKKTIVTALKNKYTLKNKKTISKNKPKKITVKPKKMTVITYKLTNKIFEKKDSNNQIKDDNIEDKSTIFKENLATEQINDVPKNIHENDVNSTIIKSKQTKKHTSSKNSPQPMELLVSKMERIHNGDFITNNIEMKLIKQEDSQIACSKPCQIIVNKLEEPLENNIVKLNNIEYIAQHENSAICLPKPIDIMVNQPYVSIQKSNNREIRLCKPQELFIDPLDRNREITQEIKMQEIRIQQNESEPVETSTNRSGSDYYATTYVFQNVESDDLTDETYKYSPCVNIPKIEKKCTLIDNTEVKVVHDPPSKYIWPRNIPNKSTKPRYRTL